MKDRSRYEQRHRGKERDEDEETPSRKKKEKVCLVQMKNKRVDELHIYSTHVKTRNVRKFGGEIRVKWGKTEKKGLKSFNSKKKLVLIKPQPQQQDIS